MESLRIVHTGRNVLLLLFVIIMLSGCAIGRKTSYEGRSDFNFANKSGHSVLVAVHDMRPYVQSGNKNNTFTGIQKSLYGIPYNVTTSTGNPLADDLGLMIANTLLYRGTNSSYQPVPYTWSFDDFKNNVLRVNTDKDVYYVEMFEWKTETHFKSALHFDLALHVFDINGIEIASNNEKGFFYFDKEQPGRENLSTATTGILENLFALDADSALENAEDPVKTATKMHPKPDAKMVSNDSIFNSIPEDIKIKIKKKCEKDHPDDFAMQATCSKKQIDGWNVLHE